MFSTLCLPATKEQQGVKRLRDKYSPVICLGCRARRIRCELPKDLEIPRSGEVLDAQEPCYRCRRLGLRCVVRQTILGRPNGQGSTTAASRLQRSTTRDRKTGLWMDESTSMISQLNTSVVCGPGNHQIDSAISRDSKLDQSITYWKGETLLLYEPRSSDAIIIIHALDTIRHEKVEGDWFRHLPAYYGHTSALDLAVQAQVQACAYTRGVAGVTSRDCYKALSLAFDALGSSIESSCGHSDDSVLAATALLAPFEGTISRNGIPTRLHLNGMAAIIVARSATQAVTQLARDIIDWYAGESCIMACFQGTSSPFEMIPRAYFTNEWPGCHNSDRAQLMALGNELSVRIPRLVMLMRTLRSQSEPSDAHFLEAHGLLQSLLELQNTGMEERFMESFTWQSTCREKDNLSSGQHSCFASTKDYDALACYWHGRLSLLRLEKQLHVVLASVITQSRGTDAQQLTALRSFGPKTNEMRVLAMHILMSADYAAALPLFRQQHLLAHAMIAVWGATRGLSVRQAIESTDVLSESLLRTVNRSLNIKPKIVAEDMDEAAEIFVGGQLKGRIAELYGL